MPRDIKARNEIEDRIPVMSIEKTVMVKRSGCIRKSETIDVIFEFEQ